MKIALAFVAGGALATGLIVACSDDSPGDADAATCDCPASEPPLAGRIVVVRGTDVVIAPNSGNSALATCPTGATMLSGSCYVVDDGGGPAQISLRASGADENNPLLWFCNWRNEPGFSATVHAEVRCLVPPT